MIHVWNDEWLERGAETALDPTLAIIDPHHHLWDDRTQPRRYLPAELQEDTAAGHNVEATVFIECKWNYRTAGPEPLRPVGETEAVVAATTAAAASGAPIRGVVAFADLTLGDAVDEVLDAHAATGDGLFRGIRHSAAHDPDPHIHQRNPRSTAELMADPQFRRGLRRLAPRGLTFDAWLYHPQLSELVALAADITECTIVLDHLGGPLGIGPYAGRRSEILKPWRRDIAALAACPNVVVKLGGIGMTIFGLGFEERGQPPTSDELVDAWGGPIGDVMGSDEDLRGILSETAFRWRF